MHVSIIPCVRKTTIYHKQPWLWKSIFALQWTFRIEFTQKFYFAWIRWHKIYPDWRGIMIILKNNFRWVYWSLKNHHYLIFNSTYYSLFYTTAFMDWDDKNTQLFRVYDTNRYREWIFSLKFCKTSTKMFIFRQKIPKFLSSP